jgi:predicted MFS family arabinose efflux permease
LLIQDNNINVIYFYGIFSSIIKSFFVPSFRSIVPNITSNNKLVKMNSLISLSNGLVALLGYAFGGLIVSYFSYKAALTTDMITFLASSVILSFLRIKKSEINNITFKKYSNNYILFLKEHHKLIPIFVIIVLFWCNIGVSSTLIIPYLEKCLNLNEKDIGILFSFDALGTITFSYMISKIERADLKSYYLPGILIGSSLPLLYTLNNSYVYFIFIFFISRLGGIINNVYIDTFVQTNFPREIQSKIFGIIHVVNHTGMSIGILISGLLAEKSTIVSTFQSSFIITILMIGVWFMNRRNNFTA